MRAVGVIPARYGARRLPGKPLVSLAGRPLVQWVWEGARQAKRLERVVVATDDERVARACGRFGAETLMTASDHPSGTDRVAEVARRVDAEIFVNIQGDEPLIEGWVIDRLVETLAAERDCSIATLAHPAAAEARDDPNRVKVVLDRHDHALYFSRSPIPFVRHAGQAPRLWQHIGLYAYRRDFLLELVRYEPTPLERAEGLEQLRALENGHPIRVVRIEGWESAPVDVPEDLPAVEARLRARQGPR